MRQQELLDLLKVNPSPMNPTGVGRKPEKKQIELSCARIADSYCNIYIYIPNGYCK
jgi:hypothetical protein